MTIITVTTAPIAGRSRNERAAEEDPGVHGQALP